jgi:hypothetical protein
MKIHSRVRHVAIAVLLGLLASSAAFANECWITCKCRSQCSTPCTDVGELVTCGVYGLCECNAAVTSRGRLARPRPQAAEPARSLGAPASPPAGIGKKLARTPALPGSGDLGVAPSCASPSSPCRPLSNHY